ncbi:MAG: translation protein [Monoraphidium minutum]|nr:MAG: translation protein [Monoraphidium minutum]
MTQEWDEFGARVPLTVLWIDDCRVLRHKGADSDGSDALVLAAGSKREKQLHPRQLGEFKAMGLPPARTLWECPVTPDALLPPGTSITAAHFVAGQYLDITGTTKGKGFAGVMKRWGFAGQPASHGNTKAHRRPGSIGGRTDPGKVWKGKKMAGHMGAESKTVKNVWLYKVDTSRNLLYVRGQVPGPAGSQLLLRDAFRWRWPARAALGLPFPTVLPTAPGDAAAGGVTVAKRDTPDPYERYRSDVGEYAEGATWKTE